MASNFVAVFDACVLYKAPVRDLLMHLSLTGLFRARWTNRIHDEWIGALLQKRPDLDPGQLQRTRELMDEAVADCLVDGYEGIEATVELPDPDDRQRVPHPNETPDHRNLHGCREPWNHHASAKCNARYRGLAAEAG